MKTFCVKKFEYDFLKYLLSLQSEELYTERNFILLFILLILIFSRIG